MRRVTIVIGVAALLLLAACAAQDDGTNGLDGNGIDDGMDDGNGMDDGGQQLAPGECAEPRPEVCTALYDPVCGQHGDGTTATYSNACAACRDESVVRYDEGACPDQEGLQEATITNAELAPSPIEALWCDVPQRTLRFTVRNTGETTWDLNQETMTGPDSVPVGLHLNWYEMNKRIRNFDPQGDGRLFGPEERFSDNCLGDGLLEPGEATTCTLTPAPLDERSDTFLFVESPSVSEIVTFRCGT